VPRQEECLAPESSSHGIDHCSTGIDGFDTQRSASFIAPVIEAQVAFLELTSQCALAWINAPMMVMASLSGAALSADRTTQESQPGDVRGGPNRVSGGLGTSGFVPVITGIDDTLRDEFFEPRPARMSEREMAALWKRSNEFEPRRANANSSDSRQEAA
jgi:hypothetical protein